jgi:hypothetical protein
MATKSIQGNNLKNLENVKANKKKRLDVLFKTPRRFPLNVKAFFENFFAHLVNPFSSLFYFVLYYIQKFTLLQNFGKFKLTEIKQLMLKFRMTTK